MLQLHAASLGLPYLPVRMMQGSGLVKFWGISEEKRRTMEGVDNLKCVEIENPLEPGEKLLAVPVPKLDCAIIHVQQASPDGTCIIEGDEFHDVDVAVAAKKVIVTCEELVSDEYIRRDPTLTKVFGECVSAVCHVPFGAWPSQCYNYYDNDSHALKEYDKASKYQDKADAVEQLAKAAAKAVKALEKAPADEKLKLAAEAAEKAAKAAAAGELILAEARRCDYTPSLLAKGLRMKRTNTLGLLIPQVSNPYFADIASAIIREARSHGYTVMVVDTMENEENEQEGIRTMLSRRVDGIVAVPCGRTPDHLEKVNRSVPVMLVDRSFERTSLPYVCTDNYRGGVEATRILLQRGHRRIACIQGVPHSMPNRRRVQGYLDALRQAGLQEEAIITGDAFSLENGYRQTKLAVAGPDRPTAIFALSNTILLGAVKAIRESGLRIPEDISVVSFDDNPYLDFLVPAITRIGQPVEEIGKTAVRLLLESIREEVRCRTQLQLPPERIVRDSVANPRTAK